MLSRSVAWYNYTLVYHQDTCDEEFEYFCKGVVCGTWSCPENDSKQECQLICKDGMYKVFNTVCLTYSKMITRCNFYLNRIHKIMWYGKQWISVKMKIAPSNHLTRGNTRCKLDFPGRLPFFPVESHSFFFQLISELRIRTGNETGNETGNTQTILLYFNTEHMSIT